MSVPSAAVPLDARDRSFGLSWPLLIGVAVPLAVMWRLHPSLALLDGDIYWHLGSARWIVENGRIPAADPFSHSMPAAPWIAHEWLSQLLYLAAHSLGGWPGMSALAAGAFGLTLAILMRFLMVRMEPPRALLLTALSGGLLLTHFLARPHVLAWPLMAFWVATLLDAAEHRRTPPYPLAALMLVWANLHGSFTLGVLLVAPIALEAVLVRQASERLAAIRQWSFFIALAVSASFATPNGWHSWWFTLHIKSLSFTLSQILEWQSPNFQNYQPIELWLVLLLGLALAGWARLPWIRIVLTLGLLHLALRHARHGAVVALVTPLLFARPFDELWSRLVPPAARDVATLDRIAASLARRARPLAVGIVLAVAAVLLSLAAEVRRHAPAPMITPAAALAAARAAQPPGPVLNGYEFGGYLIHEGVPVFIDGRADVYGDAFVKRFVEAIVLKSRESLLDLLEQYEIGWTLLAPGTPAIAVLDALPGWRRLHADDVAVVHVRDAR